MEITLSLCLPREEFSIPVVRHIARAALVEARVHEECIDDIEVALAEACTNVLKHSGTGEEYEVIASVDEDRCTIRVVDAGHGFDAEALGRRGDDISAEEGRGIRLMRALADRVQFVSRPDDGTIVHLEKGLSFRDRSLLGRGSA